jgi:DNA-binding MarR family transcriptional regulator
MDLSLIPEQCAAFNLRRAARAISRRFEEVIGKSGLRGTQFTLLVAISTADGAPVTAIADALGLERTTLTRNLTPLERDGLLKIAPGSDRRVRRLHLTAKGRSALEQALPYWKRAQESVIADLGSKRWNELLDGLKAAATLG